MRAFVPTRRDAGLTPLVVLLSVVAFALFGFFVVVLWNRVPRAETVEEIRARERLARLMEVKERDARVLDAAAPYWIDKGKGVVGLPIDRAMGIFIAENQGRQPAPSSVPVSLIPVAAPDAAVGSPDAAAAVPAEPAPAADPAPVAP